MKRKRWLTVGAVLVLSSVVTVVALTASTKDDREQPSSSPAGAQRVRQAAVAGLFYPKAPDALAEMVESFLAKANARSLGKVRGLICPHAGLAYSGQTAAEAYKQLSGQNVRTVVIMAPSHYAAFEAASIPDVEAYETPLGEVKLSPKARKLAGIRPFACNPACEVHRPQWWRQASKEVPPFGTDTPHTWEHSLEVQLPFLQKTLKDCTIVPIVFGRMEDVRPAAEAIVRHVLDDETVLVASSDLSHYYPYEVATRLDGLCIEAILKLDVEGMKAQEACGMRPILTLMHIARQKGWKSTLLKYCNSGDTAGEKSAVVGYAAIAFFEPAPGQGGSQTQPVVQTRAAQTQGGAYGPEEQKLLLSLARRTVRQVVTAGTLPEVDATKLSPALTKPKGCFVTLTMDGKLRGCIGHIMPAEPLYKAVMDNARSAATLDKRFDPVRAEELEKIEIEISILTVPRRLYAGSPLELLAKLRPGTDGVVLQVGSQQATYLPQVWEQFPNKGVFLSSLAAKAGLPASAWQHSSAVVWTYQVQAFKESEM